MRPSVLGALGAIVVIGGLAIWLAGTHRIGNRQAGLSEDSSAERTAAATSDLPAMVRKLPADISQRILARQALFLQMMGNLLAEPGSLFLLVDKDHPLAPDYEPADLVPLSDYSLSLTRKDLVLRKLIMPAVTTMANAAAADGVSLVFASTYRSYAYQRVVYDREVKLYGKTMADRESAVPGASQHQLGTAIDFNPISDDFGRTRASAWLVAHAEEYGFSLSYPKGYEAVTGYRYESWHYRYITPAGTRMQREFFDDVQQYLLEFLHDNYASFAGSDTPAAGTAPPAGG